MVRWLSRFFNYLDRYYIQAGAGMQDSGWTDTGGCRVPWAKLVPWPKLVWAAVLARGTRREANQTHAPAPAAPALPPAAAPQPAPAERRRPAGLPGCERLPVAGQFAAGQRWAAAGRACCRRCSAPRRPAGLRPAQVNPHSRPQHPTPHSLPSILHPPHLRPQTLCTWRCGGRPRTRC